MKSVLITIAVISVIATTGCKKDNAGSRSGSPIGDALAARLAFSKINDLWENNLKPALGNQNQDFEGTTVTDSTGGTAVVYGNHISSRQSGSSSGSSSYTYSVSITFRDYSAAGLKLNGSLRFYDWISSRTSCGGSGCATSTHGGVYYDTTDSANAPSSAIRIHFKGSANKSYQDNIFLHADRPYSTFSVSLINSGAQTFNFSY